MFLSGRALRLRVIVTAVLLGWLTPSPSSGIGTEILPTGFTIEPVVINEFGPGRPTAFAFLPDGRILFADRTTGEVRLHAGPGSGAALLYTVPDVTITGERGLLGLAVDPAWPSRPYLYLYYTHVSSNAYVTMLTASGDLTSPTSSNLTLSSPFHILTDIPDSFDIHNGGTLRFGTDGMLYLSVGDDASACNAQNPASLAGGILRLDVTGMPGVGSGPPPKADITPSDNPLPGPDENERLQWAWGLRNPFRFTIDSTTNDIYVGDVGLSSFEEVDRIPFPGGAGRNFGWPHLEGFVDPGLNRTCGENEIFTDPEYVYANPGGASIIIGPLVRVVPASALSMPAEYEGSLFIMEFWQGWIRRLVNPGSGWVVAPPVPGQPSSLNWAEGFHYWADFQQGPDGALYLLHPSDFPSSQGLHRIIPPTATSVSPNSTQPRLSVDVAPNPTAAGTSSTFRWNAPVRGAYELKIYDATGRVLRTLAQERASAGPLEQNWDGRSTRGTPVPAGVYFFRLTGPNNTRSGGRVVLVR